MSDRPRADDLLATAREAVLDQLIPELPPAAQYTARMVANAMAIARRENMQPALPQALLLSFRALAGIDDPDQDDDQWCRALVQRIRSGVFDDDAALQARLLHALQAWTDARLAISNPRLLDLPAA